MTSTADRYLSIEEAAKALNVSVSYVYKLTSAKRVPFYRIGKRVVFDPAELKDWMRRRRVPTVEEEVAG